MRHVMSKRTPWNSIHIILFFFLASLYMITMTGDPTTSMGVSAYETAESIVENGDFSLEKPTLETGIGKDGRYYTYEGLAFILVVTFFYSIGNLLGADTVKFVWLTNQIITATACVMLFLIAREVKYSKKTSLLLSLVYGIGTMAWVHSRFLMPEPFTTLVYLAAFLFLLRYKNRKESKWLFLCGCFTGLAIIVRPDAPFFIFGILIGMVVLLYRDHRASKRQLGAIVKKGLIFLAPLIFFFAIFAYYNYARFGDVFELGYATKAQEVAESKEGDTESGGSGGESRGGGKVHHIKGVFDTLVGFAGMWIIPCRSMFFINPVLIFIFLALKDFWRKFKFECIVIGILFILHVGLYSNRGAGFAGSSTWGVRYMIPMTSFMVVVMGVFVEKARRRRKTLFKVFMVLFIVSAIIQFIGVSQTSQLTQMMLEEKYNTPEDNWIARKMMTMNPEWNLITQNIKLLVKGETTDLMYYWYFYMKSGDVPGWVSGSLAVLVLLLLTSGYFLFKMFIPAKEPERREKNRREKRRKGRKI